MRPDRWPDRLVVAYRQMRLDRCGRAYRATLGGTDGSASSQGSSLRGSSSTARWLPSMRHGVIECSPSGSCSARSSVRLPSCCYVRPRQVGAVPAERRRAAGCARAPGVERTSSTFRARPPRHWRSSQRHQPPRRLAISGVDRRQPQLRGQVPARTRGRLPRSRQMPGPGSKVLGPYHRRRRDHRKPRLAPPAAASRLRRCQPSPRFHPNASRG
jgi:hypothetical protein